jgi:hypothetical protein
MLLINIIETGPTGKAVAPRFVVQLGVPPLGGHNERRRLKAVLQT